MVFTKEKLTNFLREWLPFIYLTLFPLGQLIRINYPLFGLSIRIHPTDLVVFSSLAAVIFSKPKLPKVFNYISPFLYAAGFSLVFSLASFSPKELFIGGLYLLRFLSYAAFFVLVYRLSFRRERLKQTLFNSLILVSLVTAIFGWIQYFWLPDLRTLKLLGWDDHLYRLVGTFLDPSFTGIILVFGFLLSMIKFIKTNDRKLLLMSAFFMISVAFTYSRSSYLSLFTGLFLLPLFVKRSVKNILAILTIGFLLVVLSLPRPESEGVKLERTHSIYAKVQNYQETMAIIRKNPLFGIGFNNMCLARKGYFGDAGYESHSCSGADSSLLFVAATTGIVGFFIFLAMAMGVLKAVKKNIYGLAFLATSAALFTHSLFTNSLFYPWVMGYMGILLATGLKE